MSHSRLTELFERISKVGDIVIMSELYKQLGKEGMVIGSGHSKRALTAHEVYAMLGHRLKCLDPKIGKFKRTS